MDFVADALFDGRCLRALTAVDNYTRASLTIDVSQALKGEDVVNTFTRIVAQRGLPARVMEDEDTSIAARRRTPPLPPRVPGCAALSRRSLASRLKLVCPIFLQSCGSADAPTRHSRIAAYCLLIFQEYILEKLWHIYW
jgi:hypothetical protein